MLFRVQGRLLTPAQSDPRICSFCRFWDDICLFDKAFVSNERNLQVVSNAPRYVYRGVGPLGPYSTQCKATQRSVLCKSGNNPHVCVMQPIMWGQTDALHVFLASPNIPPLHHCRTSFGRLAFATWFQAKNFMAFVKLTISEPLPDIKEVWMMCPSAMPRCVFRRF